MSTTSENNKRIAKNTALLYVRTLLIMLVTLYTSRVVLRVLGVTDFGIYNVVGGVVTMLGFLNGAMTTATQRYLTFELGKNNLEKLRKVFNISQGIHGALSLLVVLLAETVGLWFLYHKMLIPADRLDAALWVYHAAVLSSVLLMMSVPYNAAIVAHEKMNVFAYISILEAILKLLIVFVLQIGDVDKLKLYAVLILVVQLLIRILYGAYCKRHFEEVKFRFLWDKGLFKEMMGFAGWSVYGSISYILYTQGLNVLLNLFFGPIVNAARGIAVQVQAAVMTFSMNFQMALNPQITKSYATNDLNRMRSLVFTSSKYSFLLLLLFALPLMIETRMVLNLWLSEVPEYTVDFVRIILGVSMVDALAGPFIISVQATGDVRKYHFIVGNSLILTVVAAYVALKLGCTPQDVFWVQLIMIVLTLLVRLWIVKPMIKIRASDFISKVVLRVLLVFSLSVFPPSLIYHFMFGNSSIFRFLFVLLSSVVTVGGMSYIVGMEKKERAFVNVRVVGYLNQVKKKFIK